MTTTALLLGIADEQRRRDAEWEAQPMWRRGEVVPARITLHLDWRGLYGPEVDRACGVKEPAVDEWEAGTRYPDWPELCALARLVDVPVTAFFGPVARFRGPIFLCSRSHPSKSLVLRDVEPVQGYPIAVWRPVVEHLGTLW